MIEKVSVLCVSYNHAPYLQDALDSILQQKIPNQLKAELILMDDASTDGSADIMQQFVPLFLAAHWDVKTHFHSANQGFHQTFRKGFSQVSGDVLMILEGDDFWSDNQKIEKQIAVFATDASVALVFSQCHVVNSAGQHLTTTPALKKAIHLTDLCQENLIFTPTVAYRYDKEFPRYDWLFSAPVVDWLLHLHFASRGRVVQISEVLATYRQHSSGSWSGLKTLERYNRWLKAIDIAEQNVVEKSPDSRSLQQAFDRNRQNTIREMLIVNLAHFKWVSAAKLYGQLKSLNRNLSVSWPWVLRRILTTWMPAAVKSLLKRALRMAS